MSCCLTDDALFSVTFSADCVGQTDCSIQNRCRAAEARAAEDTQHRDRETAGEGEHLLCTYLSLVVTGSTTETLTKYAGIPDNRC